MMCKYARHYYTHREDDHSYFQQAFALWLACEEHARHQPHLTITSMLDVGCASGSLLRAWRRCEDPEFGVANMVGIDCGRIPRRRWLLKGDPKAKYIAMDLDKVGAKDSKIGCFDLVTCIEVAEHIDPKNEQGLADFLAGCLAPKGLLVVSWAPPGQRGKGHVNCVTPEHAKELFKKAGLVVMGRTTRSFRKLGAIYQVVKLQNIVVYANPGCVLDGQKRITKDDKPDGTSNTIQQVLLDWPPKGTAIGAVSDGADGDKVKN